MAGGVSRAEQRDFAYGVPAVVPCQQRIAPAGLYHLIVRVGIQIWAEHLQHFLVCQHIAISSFTSCAVFVSDFSIAAPASFCKDAAKKENGAASQSSGRRPAPLFQGRQCREDMAKKMIEQAEK